MSAVYICVLGYPRWCRLLTVGSDSHVTACRARIPADEAVYLTAVLRPRDQMCLACAADLASRTPTADLRPSVRVLGVIADISVEDDLAVPVEAGE